MSYLESLKRELREMWAMVLLQYQKTLTALLSGDKDLAREVILIEERVNSCEQFVESDCEHYFSLRGSHSPDTRSVMFSLKTARRLEILGDLANKIANDIINERSYSQRLIGGTKIAEAFDRSNKIIELAMQAFADNDASLAQVAINRIGICQEMISDCDNLLIDYFKQHPNESHAVLNLFSTLESVRRALEVTHSVSVGVIKNNEIPSLQV